MSRACGYSVSIRCVRNARARATMSRQCSRAFRRMIATIWSRTAKFPSPANFVARIISLRRARLEPILIDGALGIGRVEGESGYLDVEMFPGLRDHAIAAGHETRWCRERHAAGVFERLTCLQSWFFADHARAFHLLQAATCIGDTPMACFELNGFFAEVRDVDGVGPEEIAVR